MMGLSYQTSIHKVKDFHMAHGHMATLVKLVKALSSVGAHWRPSSGGRPHKIWMCELLLSFSKCGFHVKSQGVMLHHLQGDGYSIRFHLYIFADLYIVYDVGMSNNPKTILLLLVLIYALYLFHTC